MKHVILTFLALCLAAFPALAQMYRWVDANGQVHYSSSPPASSEKAEWIKPRKLPPVNGGEAEVDTTADEKAKEAEQKQAAYNQAAQQKAQRDEQQIKDACDSMRQDLALYQNYPRARVDVDGVTRRLTPEELNTRIADLQKNIGDNCQGY